MILVESSIKPIEKQEQRSSETRVYELDCSKLLDKADLITSVRTEPKTACKSKLGKLVYVTVYPKDIGTAQYADDTYKVFMDTILGNTRVVHLPIRVHP